MSHHRDSFNSISMASCCSRGPFFFVISVTLATMVISSVVHFLPKNTSQEEEAMIFVNASLALRQSGFNLMADIFQHHHPPFLILPPNSTFFAIKDSAFTNTSLSPHLLKHILHLHTSPSMICMHNLLKKPKGSFIPTMFHHKHLSITKVDARKRSVEINHVLISNPDIYLQNQIAIHGVLAPFYDESSNSNVVIAWNRIVQLLSSNGYASFSIALHSVMDKIVETDSVVSYDSVTILAPPDLALLGCSSSLLDRAVRVHILPQGLTYAELASLPRRTMLKTLMDNEYVEIDHGVSGVLAINGVEIVAPDISTSDKFVIHGMSKAFELNELIS